MSRLGKIPVTVPANVKVSVQPKVVQLEGPKGKLSLALPYGISIEQKDSNLVINRKGDLKQDRSNHGAIRSILVNMIEGVTKGHRKDLEIQGVGFRAAVQGSKLILNVGLSHQVEYDIPKDVKVTTAKPTEVAIEGMDKALVGKVAAEIRRVKPPEPYKGKGIRYSGEVVRRKQGKSVTK